MNIAEQIKGFEETRKTKTAAMNAIMEKAAEEGRTLDAAETESYETAKDEIKATDAHLLRLEGSGDNEQGNGAAHRGSVAHARARPGESESHGKAGEGHRIRPLGYVLGPRQGNLNTAFSIAQKRYPHSENINLTLKSAVEAGTTTDPDWAGPLVDYNQFAGDFVEWLRPQTIIGKFGTGNIPSLRRCRSTSTFAEQRPAVRDIGSAKTKHKPLTKFNFEDVYLGFAKVANIAVLTDELVRFSNPSAETLVRQMLADAVIEVIDETFH